LLILLLIYIDQTNHFAFAVGSTLFLVATTDRSSILLEVSFSEKASICLAQPLGVGSIGSGTSNCAQA